MTSDEDTVDEIPDLEAVFHEIAKEVHVADATHEMLKLIGNHADQINAAGFGLFFGYLQGALTSQFILSISKVYERPKGYVLNSIPQAIKTMEYEEVINRPYLIGGLELCGFPRPELEKLNNSGLAAQIIEIAKVERSNKTINRLETLRNKKIAHNEAIDLSRIEKPLWEEAEQVLEFAKRFVAIAGGSYFNIAFGDQDYRFAYEYDARKVAANLTRLLKAAGVAEPATN